MARLMGHEARRQNQDNPPSCGHRTLQSRSEPLSRVVITKPMRLVEMGSPFYRQAEKEAETRLGHWLWKTSECVHGPSPSPLIPASRPLHIPG